MPKDLILCSVPLVKTFSLLLKQPKVEEYGGLKYNVSIAEFPRVMSLRDGMKKMSKSDTQDANRINLTDDPELIIDKIIKAKTDSIPKVGDKMENDWINCGNRLDMMIIDQKWRIWSRSTVHWKENQSKMLKINLKILPCFNLKKNWLPQLSKIFVRSVKRYECWNIGVVLIFQGWIIDGRSYLFGEYLERGQRKSQRNCQC